MNLQECCYEVRQDDDHRRSVVQQILQKSQKITDFLRLIIAPVGGQGGVTLSCVCPHCHRFPLEDWVFDEAREETVQLVVRGMRPVRLEDPEQGLWLFRTARTAARRKCFGPTLRRRVYAKISCAPTSSWRTSSLEETVLCRCWGPKTSVPFCKNGTQLLHISHKSHRTFVTILFLLFVWLFLNLSVRKRALIAEFSTDSDL